MKAHYFLIPAILFFACNSGSDNNGNTSDTTKTTENIDTSKTTSDIIRKLSETPEFFYKHFEGTIGSETYVLDIVREKNILHGSICQLPNGNPLSISGTLTKDYKFQIKSVASQVSKSFSLSGQFEDGIVLAGKSKADNFLFKETYAQSIPLDVFTIEQKDSIDESTVSKDAKTIIIPSKNYEQTPVKDSVLAHLKKMYFSEEKNLSDIEKHIKNYKSKLIADFKTAYKNGETQVSWESQQLGDVIMNYKNILTIAVHSYEFSGGMHGNFADVFFIFDLKTGKLFTRKDIFIENADKKISEIIFEKIKEKRGFSDSDMRENYEQNPLPLTENIYITPGGIGFAYNPYEISSYANGPDDVFIPFKDIKDLLKNDFKKRFEL